VANTSIEKYQQKAILKSQEESTNEALMKIKLAILKFEELGSSVQLLIAL
jgi:hypothetical protein